MGELAVLSEWAVLVFHEVLAKLSFIFLFQRVKLSLISIEVFVIGLLGQLSYNFAWWVVEISFSLLVLCSFLLILIFQISIFRSLGRTGIFFRIVLLSFSSFNLKVLRVLVVLNWSLRIWRWSFLGDLDAFCCLSILLFLRLVVLGLFFVQRFFWILNCHFFNITKIFIIYICRTLIDFSVR